MKLPVCLSLSVLCISLTACDPCLNIECDPPPFPDFKYTVYDTLNHKNALIPPYGSYAPTDVRVFRLVGSNANQSPINHINEKGEISLSVYPYEVTYIVQYGNTGADTFLINATATQVKEKCCEYTCIESLTVYLRNALLCANAACDDSTVIYR